MKKSIKEFINSGLVESDFYHLEEKDLIALKEYLLELKSKDEEFKKLISAPATSVKEKCDWVDEIGFDSLQFSNGEYISSMVRLFGKEYGDMLAELDPQTGTYRDFFQNPPIIYLAFKSVRKRLERQKDLPLIQDELLEIDETGRQVYNGILNCKKSVSGNFDIVYTPQIGLTVWNDDALLAAYLERKLPPYNRIHLKDVDQAKTLTRIQLKKK